MYIANSPAAEKRVAARTKKREKAEREQDAKNKKKPKNGRGRKKPDGRSREARMAKKVDAALVRANVRVPGFTVSVKRKGEGSTAYGDALTYLSPRTKAELVRDLEMLARHVQMTDDDFGGGCVYVLRRRKTED